MKHVDIIRHLSVDLCSQTIIVLIKDLEDRLDLVVLATSVALPNA